YESYKHLYPYNLWISRAAFTLFFGQIFFIVNFFKSVFMGSKATQNPWEVGTLEWTHAASPPKHHNFDLIPDVLHGPHEFGNPAVKDKDWLGQAEELPAVDDAAAKAKA